MARVTSPLAAQAPPIREPAESPVGWRRFRWRTAAWPLLLVTVGLGFALVPLANGSLFFYWDNAQQHYPQTDFLHRALRAGHIPQWWPQVGSGVPTIGEGQAAHYHPIRLLLAAVLAPPAAFMLEIGVYLAAAGLATYFFLRQFRLRRSACAVGALVEMFGSFSIVFLRNVALHRAFFLFPAAMLCAERFARRRRASAAFGAAFILGLQLLAGHPTFAVVTAVVSTIYIACRMLQRSWAAREPLPLAVRQLAASTLQWSLVIVLGIGIAAIQVVPTLLHAGDSIREGGLSFEFANSLPAKIEYLPQLLFPYAYPQGDWLAEPTSWGSQFNTVASSGIYVGALPVVLALLAVWWRRRWPDPGWPLAICGLASLAFALGKMTPLFPALWSLPGLSGFRYPSRFLLPVSFCLACLAALGLHRALARTRLGGLKTRDYVPFILLGAVALALAGVLWLWRAELHGGILASLLLLAASMGLVLALLAAPRRGQSVLLVGALLFVLADLWTFRAHSGYAPTVPIADALTPPPLVDFLATDRDRFRVMSLISVEEGLNRNEDLREFLQADLPAIWGIESADMWFSLMPKRYYALHEAILWELTRSPDAAEKLAGVLGALNVKYVIAPLAVTLRGWEMVYETARARTWKNPAHLARAFLVGAAVPEPIEVRAEWVDRSTKRLERYRETVASWWSRLGDAQIIDHILARPIDYRTTAVIAGGALPALSGLDPQAVVRALSDESDTMRFAVDSRTPSFLVISNSDNPGWTASVNGRSAAVRRANWVTMGVALPAGHSEVVLRFVAPGFRVGCLLTALSIAIAVAGMMFARRRQLAAAADRWTTEQLRRSPPLAAVTARFHLSRQRGGERPANS